MKLSFEQYLIENKIKDKLSVADNIAKMINQVKTGSSYKKAPRSKLTPQQRKELISKIAKLSLTGKSDDEITRELNLTDVYIKSNISDIEQEKVKIKAQQEKEANNVSTGSFEDFYNKSADNHQNKSYLTQGKLFDRYKSLNATKQAIEEIIANKSDTPTLNILSLPHSYGFEKSLVNQFNVNVNSYGINLPQYEKEQRKYARQARNSTDYRITPFLGFGNINVLIRKRNGIPFSRYDRYTDTVLKPSNQFDIIDLDYKGFPGTLQTMRLKNDNPWVYPVIAASDYLKKGGLLMVTYLADTWRVLESGKPMFQTMMDNPKNILRKYVNSPDFINSGAYLNPNTPDKNVVDSFKKRNNREGALEVHYPRAATVGNMCTENIIKLSNEMGINLEPLWINIYPGGKTSFMYRAIFKKLN